MVSISQHGLGTFSDSVDNITSSAKSYGHSQSARGRLDLDDWGLRAEIEDTEYFCKFNKWPLIKTDKRIAMIQNMFCSYCEVIDLLSSLNRHAYYISTSHPVNSIS